LGAKITKGDVRMTVLAGLTVDTWHWLILQGWREETFRNDRRAYREIPYSRVAEFFDASDLDERTQLLQLAIAEARVRPVVTLSGRH
jgi:hypothetical protein